MGKFIDRTGTEINGIKFLKRIPGGKKVKWLCLCTCGRKFEGYADHISEGRKCPNCGRKTQALKISKHQGYKDALYSVWLSMKQRCSNPNATEYKNYGARGITVCDEWANDYQSFKEWATRNGYKQGLSIDRIDNNGNYEPSNCRWANMTTQALNKRSNHLITFEGKTLPVSEMARIYGFRPCVIERRICRGWTVQRALTTPLDITKIYR